MKFINSRISRGTAGVIIFLTATILAIYGQTGGHAFIEYDDQVYLLENPHVRSGLSLENIKWAFTAVYAANWHPLTWLSHMLDVQLFGLNPQWHHLTNVFLHTANAALLFILISRMTNAFWKSAVVAALFALHPLHVESVAWAAERKDLLSTLFWIATLHLYVNYVRSPSLSRYLQVAVAYSLGLMAKPMLVTLPILLLLLDFWPLQRLAHGKGSNGALSQLRSLIAEKLPFLLLAVAMSSVTMYAQRHGNAITTLEASPLAERLQNALSAYPGYLAKMFWPADLAVFYPFLSTIPAWKTVSAAMFLITVSAAVIRIGRRSPYLAVGWFWYIITLVPVIGIVRVGLQAMADRYTYMPLTGIFIMLVWGAEELLNGCSMIWHRLSYGITAIVVTVCAGLSWQQTSYWRDTPTLFTHALAATGDNFMAYSVIGRHLEREGRLDEALDSFNKALEIAPWYEYAKVHQGIIMMNQGRLDAAVFKYNEAILQNPTSVTGHINLGIVMALQNRHDDAISNFRIALDFNPQSQAAHYNLGLELAKSGKLDEAILHYTKALEVDPRDVNCHNNIGIALAEMGRLDEAISHFSAALKLKPDYFDAHSNRELAIKKKHAPATQRQ